MDIYFPAEPYFIIFSPQASQKPFSINREFICTRKEDFFLGSEEHIHKILTHHKILKHFNTCEINKPESSLHPSILKNNTFQFPSTQRASHLSVPLNSVSKAYSGAFPSNPVTFKATASSSSTRTNSQQGKSLLTLSPSFQA